jgi:hypothetical protein
MDDVNARTLPGHPVKAGSAGYDCNCGGCLSLPVRHKEYEREAARIEGAADARERLAAVISPDQFRKLADWFDADDQLKMILHSQVSGLPPGWAQRGQEMQDDLRRFAALLEGRLETAANRRMTNDGSM